MTSSITVVPFVVDYNDNAKVAALFDSPEYRTYLFVFPDDVEQSFERKYEGPDLIRQYSASNPEFKMNPRSIGIPLGLNYDNFFSKPEAGGVLEAIDEALGKIEKLLESGRFTNLAYFSQQEAGGVPQFAQWTTRENNNCNPEIIRYITERLEQMSSTK